MESFTSWKCHICKTWFAFGASYCRYNLFNICIDYHICITHHTYVHIQLAEVHIILYEFILYQQHLMPHKMWKKRNKNTAKTKRKYILSTRSILYTYHLFNVPIICNMGILRKHVHKTTIFFDFYGFIFPFFFLFSLFYFFKKKKIPFFRFVCFFFLVFFLLPNRFFTVHIEKLDLQFFTLSLFL